MSFKLYWVLIVGVVVCERGATAQVKPPESKLESKDARVSAMQVVDDASGADSDSDDDQDASLEALCSLARHHSVAALKISNEKAIAFARAADNGDRSAWESLKVMASLDHEVAKFYYQKKKKSCEAIFNEGLEFFRNRCENSENAAKAFKSFSLVARYGFAVAEYYLGLCYLQGVGVKQNMEQARAWIVRANYDGYTVGNTCYLLERRLGVSGDVKEDRIKDPEWLEPMSDAMQQSDISKIAAVEKRLIKEAKS